RKWKYSTIYRLRVSFLRKQTQQWILIWVATHILATGSTGLTGMVVEIIVFFTLWKWNAITQFFAVVMVLNWGLWAILLVPIACTYPLNDYKAPLELFLTGYLFADGNYLISCMCCFSAFS